MRGQVSTFDTFMRHALANWGRMIGGAPMHRIHWLVFFTVLVALTTGRVSVAEAGPPQSITIEDWRIAYDRINLKPPTLLTIAEERSSSPGLLSPRGKYTNYLIGLSLSYPKDLESFTNTIIPSTIDEEISLGQNFRRPPARKPLFGFIFSGKKFDAENHYERGWDLEEIPSSFLGNIAYALPAPRGGRDVVDNIHFGVATALSKETELVG
jgi:hypothetical protein